MDINADGHKDILVGSFSGVPQMIYGSEKGYEEPVSIKDSSDETVLIADFWNEESKKWDMTDRAETEGHCTSVEAVDWDNDGDLDLLLGDYYGGRLFVRMNEGSASEPSFATTNEAVIAGKQPIVIEHGLAAPRVVDWNEDGLFDLLLGGSKGGVYYFANTGSEGKPEFATAEVLIEPFEDASQSFIKRVPSTNEGEPMLPGSSFHIEAVDYDSDGDLDLLVGARSSWLTGPVKKLTDEEKEAKAELEKGMKGFSAKLQKMFKKADDDEKREELQESEEYKTLMKDYREMSTELLKYKTDPTKSGDFVWLFRKK